MRFESMRCVLVGERKMAKYEKNRSTRRSTPRHPIAMASAKPPDPMPCALAAILLPESDAPACHMWKTLFPGQSSIHATVCVLGPCLHAGCDHAACVDGGSRGNDMGAGGRCLSPRVGGVHWAG